MITDIEDYFRDGCGRCPRFQSADCSTQIWASGLRDLREICRGVGLAEAVRWGHPCYRHTGRNIAIIGALRSDFRLSFFNPGLMKDTEAVLERQGANTRFPDMIRFTDVDQPAAAAATISAYLREAMGYAEAGLTDPKPPDAVDLPQALTDALDADPELAEAFHALTPGRQRSYVIQVNGAKKLETKMARIAKFRDRILAGRGATER